MTFRSKFNIGDKVYFWSFYNVKIMEGKIDYVSLYYSKACGIEWNYGVSPLERTSISSERIPEHLVFNNRSDVLDFCMELTKDI